MNKLTHTAVAQAKPRDKAYKLYDGGGLYLLITPNGSKYWRIKYRVERKEKTYAIGIYNPAKPQSVSLKQARTHLFKFHEKRQQGIDPSLERQTEKKEAVDNAQNTFKAIGLEWWNDKKVRWSDAYAQRTWRSIEKDVLPYIGHLLITEIETVQVLEVIRRVQDRDALEIASCVLRRCRAIFRFAVQTGRAKYNPASDLTGVLITRKVQHRPSATRKRLPAVLKAIESYTGDPIIHYALELLCLTFVRSKELRGARWEEFDLEAKLWRIPGSRMKMNSEHLVPLSRQAVALLDKIRPLTGHKDLIFASPRKEGYCIGGNALCGAFRSMGFRSEATPHGMRATASSILNEERFNRDAIERQLSHMEANKVRAAYVHNAEYMEERTRMMEWWGDYLDQARTGSNVIPGKFGIA